eukprot:457689-Amphidinium_carterae.1
MYHGRNSSINECYAVTAPCMISVLWSLGAMNVDVGGSMVRIGPFNIQSRPRTNKLKRLQIPMVEDTAMSGTQNSACRKLARG